MIGAALDLVLLLVAAEAAALAVHHRRTRRGVAPRRLVPNLVAGFCLVLAARLCLPGGAPPAPAAQLAAAAALFAALLAHLVDLAVRWRD